MAELRNTRWLIQLGGNVVEVGALHPITYNEALIRLAKRLKPSRTRFSVLMQSLKKGVDIEDLRRAERG